MSRAQRVLRIVERFGRFYVEDQWGGFSGYHKDYDSAVKQAQGDVTDYGDVFEVSA